VYKIVNSWFSSGVIENIMLFRDRIIADAKILYHRLDNLEEQKCVDTIEFQHISDEKHIDPDTILIIESDMKHHYDKVLSIIESDIVIYDVNLEKLDMLIRNKTDPNMFKHVKEIMNPIINDLYRPSKVYPLSYFHAQFNKNTHINKHYLSNEFIMANIVAKLLNIDRKTLQYLDKHIDLDKDNDVILQAKYRLQIIGKWLHYCNLYMDCNEDTRLLGYRSLLYGCVPYDDIIKFCYSNISVIIGKIISLTNNELKEFDMKPYLESVILFYLEEYNKKTKYKYSADLDKLVSNDSEIVCLILELKEKYPDISFPYVSVFQGHFPLRYFYPNVVVERLYFIVENLDLHKDHASIEDLIASCPSVKKEIYSSIIESYLL
jgi:hypothetical protein